jgi:Tol biopolymer transport system component
MPGTLKPLDGMETYGISSDGRFIAYCLLTRDEGDRQPDGLGRSYSDVMFQSINGAAPTSLAGANCQFGIAWSPNGTRVAVARGFEGGVTILDLSGKVLQSVEVTSGDTTSAGMREDFVEDVQWQPHGESLALLDNSQLYVVSADGSALHKVPMRSPVISVISFTWSPDGKLFAFRAVTDKSCHFVLNTADFHQCEIDSSLFTSNPDGSELKKIAGTHIDSKDWPYRESRLFWIR